MPSHYSAAHTSIVYLRSFIWFFTSSSKLFWIDFSILLFIVMAKELIYFIFFLLLSVKLETKLLISSCFWTLGCSHVICKAAVGRIRCLYFILSNLIIAYIVVSVAYIRYNWVSLAWWSLKNFIIMLNKLWFFIIHPFNI